MKKIFNTIYFLLIAAQISFGQKTTTVTCPNGASVTATASSFTSAGGGTQCDVSVTLTSTIFNSSQRTNYVGLGSPSFTSNLFNGNFGGSFPNTTSNTGTITINASCSTVRNTFGAGSILIQEGGIGGPACGTLALPIELTFFTGKLTDNAIALSWQTALELNNDFFTVESSKDGSEWLELARIKGAGSSINVHNYNFVDERPHSAIAYYRLKQTDFDGKFAYSKVIAVNVDGFQNPEVNVYPNPTSNQVTIEGDEDELDELRLYNLLGQDITASTKKLSSNNIKQVLDLSLLQTGIYLIKTKTTASKVYKQ